MKKIAVSLLAVTLALFLAVPAMAQFEPYGSVRLGVFWQTYTPSDYMEAFGADDDSDLVMELGNYSRFGAKLMTGDIAGRVEFGILGDTDKVYSRLLYGTWDFGGGTLLVGQDYNPYTNISAQVAAAPIKDPFDVFWGTSQYNDLDNGFIGYGALWDSRQPQIRLDMANGLYVSVIQPETPQYVTRTMVNFVAGVNDAETDVILPKVCVGYKYKAEGISLNPGVAYNTIEVASEAADFSEDIVSYLVYLNGKAALGPADLQWSIHYGQNLADFGLKGREIAAGALVDVNGDIEDSTCYGGYLQVAFPVDPATITLGYGYTQSENDEWGDDADAQSSYFVNAKIPLSTTFFVVPEISFYDGMDDFDGDEEDDVMLAGVKFQMDF